MAHFMRIPVPNCVWGVLSPGPYCTSAWPQKLSGMISACRIQICRPEPQGISSGGWTTEIKTGHLPGRSLAQGFSLNGPCQRGVHELQICCHEEYIVFPKIFSLNTRLGHSTLLGGALPCCLHLVSITTPCLLSERVFACSFGRLPEVIHKGQMC